MLNLASFGGYVPQGLDAYTIITNAGGSAITGTFVAGAGVDNYAPGTPLLEGADLSDDFLGTGRTAILTYQGGPNGDSVVISVSAGSQLRYNGGSGTNNFLLEQNSSTQNFDLYDNGNLVVSQPIALTSAIMINVGQANDAALTVDYGGGYFTNKITFDGGTGSGTIAKTLTFMDSPATLPITSESFTYLGPQQGDIQLGAEPIAYSDLAEVADAASITAANVSFTLPANALAAFGDDSVPATGCRSFRPIAAASPRPSSPIRRRR